MAARPGLGPLRRRTLAAGAVAVVSLAVIALSLLWQASEAHYRSCVTRVEARYPAAPVSAYVTRDKTAVGPLKLAFVNERSKALGGCHHFF
jgi:cell division septation protein DedD